MEQPQHPRGLTARLRGLLDGRGPVLDVDLFRHFEQSLQAELSKKDYLRSIDELRPLVYELLCDRYNDPYYAKLLYLKVTNFLVSRYHLLCRHTRLASKPVTLMVDPSNACQLRCPGCVHTSNEPFKQDFLWPAAIMKPTAYRELLKGHGPFALSAVLYNYGDPLLNPDVADFVMANHSHGMTSFFSSNVSMKFDADRLVRAGADHMILSIDGITQETYSRFRKRGNLALALENVRRLVAAKKKYGVTRPVLVWRFLTFEHNVHDVDRVIETAGGIGVDYLLVSTPFDVSSDDPGVRVARSEREGRYRFIDPETTRRAPEQILERLERRDEVDTFFSLDWHRRVAEDDPDEAKKGSGTCAWLYYSMSVDAAGRVMPCCMVPRSDQHLVFGEASDERAFNAPMYVNARLSYSDRHAYERDRAAAEREPYCATCTQAPPFSYGPPNGLQDLLELDFQHAVCDPANKRMWRLFEQSDATR